MVYVVLADKTDYDNRDVWVAGVYETEEAARQAIRDRSQVRSVWYEWNEIKESVYKRAEDLFMLEYGQPSWHSPEHFKTYVEAELAKTPLPPEPEFEGGELFFYRATEMGQWHNGRESPERDLKPWYNGSEED